jgi:hypothetical protein
VQESSLDHERVWDGSVVWDCMYMFPFVVY